MSDNWTPTEQLTDRIDDILVSAVEGFDIEHHARSSLSSSIEGSFQTTFILESTLEFPLMSAVSIDP